MSSNISNDEESLTQMLITQEQLLDLRGIVKNEEMKI